MNRPWRSVKHGLVISAAMWSMTVLAQDTMIVDHAWVREAPPHVEVSAAYLTVHNPGTQAHVLTGISSPQFEKGEIHATRIINGQVRMQRVAEVTVVALGSVAFKPGEYHLMLIHPRRRLKAGDKVELRLEFDDAPPITINAPIRKTEHEENSHHHHDMSM